MQSNDPNYGLFEVNYYYDQQQSLSGEFPMDHVNVIDGEQNDGQTSLEMHDESVQLFGQYIHHEPYGMVDDEMRDSQSCLPELDIVSDAKTYGLMLPPSYHHHQQLQQQQQQQLHQQHHQHHPHQQQYGMSHLYGNPFSYNLHTIVEESENESSLQTLSSLTSSTLQSSFEPYDVNGTSTATTATNSSNEHQQLEQQEMFSIIHNSSSSSNNSVVDRTGGNISTKMFSVMDFDEEIDGDSQSAVSDLSFNQLNEQNEEEEDEDDEDEDEHEPNCEDRADIIDLKHWNGDPLERYFTSSLLRPNKDISEKLVGSIVTNDIVDDVVHHNCVTHLVSVFIYCFIVLVLIFNKQKKF